MKKQSSSIKKGIICCLSLFCSLSIQAQKLGDYIEIDSVPAFIFYIDNTGKHGLAMSMPAVYSDMLKKIDKYVKKGLIDKRQAELSKERQCDRYKKTMKNQGCSSLRTNKTF